MDKKHAPKGSSKEKNRWVSAVKLHGMTTDTDPISPILMERHAEHEPSARRDGGSAVLDRL